MSNPGLLSVTRPLSLQTYDIDYGGVVSNIVYIRWLEDLRMAMLDQYFPLQQQLAAGYTPIVLSTQISYHRSLRLFDQPIGHMTLTDLGKTRWHVSAEIRCQDHISATAVQSGCFVNLTTLKPIPVPRAFKELWNQSLNSTGESSAEQD